MEKQINEMIKEQTKLHEQIMTLMDAKTNLDNLDGQTDNNFDEKTVVVDDKENKVNHFSVAS
ncbi:unnamed protein product [Meloidogyne enterolobii]|uniref:Uncharacterized protein n=1 Tax=Meloidogyne enterolobii TaxID=390850 RepID=A0ACB0ZJ06_MELEN